MLKNMALAVVGASVITLGIGNAIQAVTLEVVASNLDSPRGLTFGADGALYVTEAGRGGAGPCIPSFIPGEEACYGPTGALTRIQTGTVERVVTGLPSLAINGTDVNGPSDIAFDSTGQPYVLVGLGSNPANRSVLGVPDFGKLLKIDALEGGSSWTAIADVAGFEATNNPDGGEVDSNPYAFLIQGNAAYVADAGGNDLLKVNLSDGGISLESVFEERLVPFMGSEIPMQSVPTSVALGPDGALYVGQLTGFPFPEGGARIYRIGDDGTPEVYAEGFTTIADLNFDDDGNLYVLEYSTNGGPSLSGGGALIRYAPNGTRTTLLADGLTNPTAFTLGPDGDFYIANKGFVAGQGEVVRYNPQGSTSVPEPTTIFGLLAIATTGATSRLLRQ
ncbi:MAG: ScyD/ScyE family protein [Coleofasciculus sp. S288]|nr:ScyD/ScyE family protein [Coleofasciculus sp. S288]